MALVGYFAGFNEQRNANRGVQESLERSSLAEQEFLARQESEARKRQEVAEVQRLLQNKAMAQAPAPASEDFWDKFRRESREYSDQSLRKQLGLPAAGTKPTTPLVNFLGAVDSQESYRPAMMQFIAQGGKKPKWYTGDYETDKQNIEVSVTSAMTPKEQLLRQEAAERLAGAKEQREAQALYRKEQLAQRDREIAQKRAGVKPQSVAPTKQELAAGLDVLSSRLGETLFSQMPSADSGVVAREIAMAAKKNGTEIEDELDKLIASGKLTPGKEGSWFFNMGEEAPKYLGKQSAEGKIKPALPPPEVGLIKNGYRFRGGDPAKKESWEKI